MIIESLVLPNNLREKIIDFTLVTGIPLFTKQHHALGEVGIGRRFCSINKIDHPLTDEIGEFAKNCYGSLGIDIIEEVLFGNFIGFNSPGSFVHRHKDRCKIPNYDHVRLNFLVLKPTGGGMPILDGVILNVNQNECWINIASKWEHTCSTVYGETPRIILSLGSLVETSKLDWVLQKNNT
jgi:hypothetical protein